MRALIDADIVCHRIGYTTENDDVNIAKWRCDEMLEGILHETQATEYQLWLSDSLENNFRLRICPEYKANRLGKPKPKWHEQIKEHMILEWDAQIAYEQEADDALGIEQCQCKENELLDDNAIASVICSIDKDLLQIPGNHYNFVKKELTNVTQSQGITNFYRQLLIGDSGDNIPGCPGIGVVKACKALDGASGEIELFRRIYNLYTKALHPLSDADIQARILQAGQLLCIRQHEGEIWTFPKLPPTVDTKPSSTPQKPESGNPSTEQSGLVTSMSGSPRRGRPKATASMTTPNAT